MAEQDELSLIVGPSVRVCEYAKKHLDVVPYDAKPITRTEELRGYGANTSIFLIVGHPAPYDDNLVRQVQMMKALYNNVRMVKS